MRKSHVLWVPLVLWALVGAGAGQAVGQQPQGSISGTVTVRGSQRPLQGVQVHIPGTGAGTLTNAQGRFLLVDVPPGEQRVVAQLIGYGTVERSLSVAAGQSLTADFEMGEQAMELDAVVVTGTPGASQIRSLGNTVGRVEAAEQQSLAPAPTVESLLSGAEPGMNVAFGGQGRVGGGANIRIRGAGSIALSSQPLLYIDGVRVNSDNADSGPGLSNYSPPSRMQDLNPEDIESVEVIKGPAAATLYGTEASNGVINIITKRGALGDPQVSLRMGQGFNWLPDPEELFPHTFFRCTGSSGTCTPGEVIEFNVLREDRLRNGNEWFRTGMPRSFGADVSGGIERLRFYTSLDFNQDRGVLPMDWRNRLNGRANLNWTPTEKLDVQFGIAGVYSRMRDPSDNTSLATIWSCPAPGCEEGSGLANAVDGAYRGYIGFLPNVYQDSVFAHQEVRRTTYNLQLTHTPVAWFTHRLVGGADWTDVGTSSLFLPIRGVGHFSPAGSKTEEINNTQYLSLDYSATATVALTPELSFATSSGVQYHQKGLHTITAQGQRFAVTGLETISAGAQLSAAEDFLENKTIGAYVQEQVAWRNRFFLTGALRGDDNSAFGENFEFVVYPKLSGSWVISEEPFMLDVPGLDQLRLRGAWGRAGQQPDFFAAIRTYAPVPGPGGAGILTPRNIGNPDLKPEVGEEIELGFDAGLLDDRLGLEVTYYDQKRRDAIIQVPVRPSMGFPGIQFRNLGEVVNTGVEVNLTASGVYQSRRVGLDLGLSLATNDNEITSMGGVPPQILQSINPTTGWAQQLFVEGFPLGAIWLKKVVSADVQGTGAAARAVNVMCEGGEVLPTSSSTFPISRGGGAAVPCAQAPHIYRGAPIPTRNATGTATLTLFENLRLFAQVDYQGGAYMVDGNIAGAHMFFRNTQAILERTDPILLGYEAIGRDGVNQPGFMDASFAKLRRVAATYDVPQRWIAGTGADNLQLTLSAFNLWTIWRATEEVFGVRNIDPEIRITNPTSTDPGGLSAYSQSQTPPMRRVMVTLRVRF